MKKYESIYHQLSQEIKSGIFEAGSYLPTELELVKRFQVSRDTIRKALEHLSQDGYISKKQGSGSLVLSQEQFQFPVSDLTSYQELVEAQGIHSKTTVITVDKVIIDQELAKLTGFALYDRAWRIVRQRLVDDLASVLDIDYLLIDLVPTMTRDIAEHSIYAYLENELHLPIASAQKEITIDQTSETDRLLLDLGSDHHVVRVQSKGFLANQVQFQFTESRHKLDKFKFIDYAVRKH
ncbi:trehalose operon repressor [Streptococcus loxodontisalivarius]|uniref:Trehalose operon repressor n=1 Tax=Streptococcus loxodontisalivarius TaxID=1349415 RepID=A0ABS2PQH9_9STRE|nr:trehalose operon repressor [Streptococcus loxodontisalivarius]MBM7642297.1 GntR family trehalose operon transcriptional repressor [Streptococcus loxodontisalivarius]